MFERGRIKFGARCLQKKVEFVGDIHRFFEASVRNLLLFIDYSPSRRKVDMITSKADLEDYCQAVLE